MRCHDEVICRIACDRNQRIVRAQRLVGEAIDGGTAKLTVAQGINHVTFVDDSRRAAMNEMSAPLHQGEKCPIDALIVFGQIRQKTGNEIALPCQLVARNMRQSEIGLHLFRQPMPLRIKHATTKALQAARELGTDLAETQDADCALLNAVDPFPARPVESEIVLVTALGL